MSRINRILKSLNEAATKGVRISDLNLDKKAKLKNLTQEQQDVLKALKLDIEDVSINPDKKNDGFYYMMFNPEKSEKGEVFLDKITLKKLIANPSFLGVSVRVLVTEGEDDVDLSQFSNY